MSMCLFLSLSFLSSHDSLKYDMIFFLNVETFISVNVENDVSFCHEKLQCNLSFRMARTVQPLPCKYHWP